MQQRQQQNTHCSSSGSSRSGSSSERPGMRGPITLPRPLALSPPAWSNPLAGLVVHSAGWTVSGSCSSAEGTISQKQQRARVCGCLHASGQAAHHRELPNAPAAPAARCNDTPATDCSHSSSSAVSASRAHASGQTAHTSQVLLLRAHPFGTARATLSEWQRRLNVLFCLRATSVRLPG